MSLPKFLSKIGRPSFIDIIVVLAIVGGAVVVALALLNPLERLRQKEDAITYKSANALAESLYSYKAGFKKLPWEATAKEDSPTLSNRKPSQTWLEELENNGFLEESLRSQTNLKEYLIVNIAPQKVCFYPASVKYRILGKYDEGGVNECLPQGFTPCFICFEY